MSLENNSFRLTNDDSKGIYCNYTGTILVTVHVGGKSGNTGRLWCKLSGTSSEPHMLSVGEFVTANCTTVSKVSVGTVIKIEFLENFNIASGGLQPCTIHIIKLG